MQIATIVNIKKSTLNHRVSIWKDLHNSRMEICNSLPCAIKTTNDINKFKKRNTELCHTCDLSNYYDFRFLFEVQKFRMSIYSLSTFTGVEQSSCWRFETPRRSLWHHCNDTRWVYPYSNEFPLASHQYFHCLSATETTLKNKVKYMICRHASTRNRRYANFDVRGKYLMHG